MARERRVQEGTIKEQPQWFRGGGGVEVLAHRRKEESFFGAVTSPSMRFIIRLLCRLQLSLIIPSKLHFILLSTANHFDWMSN